MGRRFLPTRGFASTRRLEAVVGLLIALLAASPAAPAKQTPGARTAHEDVVVTAERVPEARESIPAAVSVLTREQIDRLPAENLAELLRFLPGFHVHFGADVGGVPMVSSRGFFGGGEAEYVQLLVDGVPVGDVESGLADWKRFRAADIERIEALRGPASALYGDTALGGLIQVFTRRDLAPGPTGEVSVSGGSFGSAAADAGGRFALGSSRVGVSASATTTEGFRQHSAAREGGADLSVHVPAATGQWSFALSGSTRDRREPGPRTAGELEGDRFESDPMFRFDREETRRGRISATWRREIGPIPTRALLYAASRNTDLTRTLLIAAGVGDRIFRSVATGAVGGSLESEKSFRLGRGEARASAGIDAARERLETAYRAVKDEGERGAEVARVSGRRDRFALFVTGAWEPLPRLRVTAGTRWDSIRDDFGRTAGGGSSRSAWSPRVGVNVRVGKGDDPPLSLFVQASRAFKAPTLDQLFDPRPFPDFSGGTFRISSALLRPQRAKTVEAGISRRDGRSSIEIVVYRTEVDDEIDFDTATFRYANIGRTLHHGVEAAASFCGRCRVSPSLSYSWNRTEPLEGENRGRQLKNVPEHLFRPGIAAALPGRVQVEALATILTGRYLDDGNRIPLEDAAVFDLRLVREFRRWKARVDLLNVTDRRWEEVGLALPDLQGNLVPYYFPAAGFAARVGMEWSFQ
jgi:vitamin B12 transporter